MQMVVTCNKLHLFCWKSLIRKEKDHPSPTSKYMARFKPDKRLTEAEKTVIPSSCKNDLSSNSELHEGNWFWKNSQLSTPLLEAHVHSWKVWEP